MIINWSLTLAIAMSVGTFVLYRRIMKGAPSHLLFANSFFLFIGCGGFPVTIGSITRLFPSTRFLAANDDLAFYVPIGAMVLVLVTNLYLGNRMSSIALRNVAVEIDQQKGRPVEDRKVWPPPPSSRE